MFQSMTGYGSAKREFATQNIFAEIKSLNSKSLDFRAKLPAAFQHKEIELRRLFQQHAIRGKVDMLITAESSLVGDFRINARAFEQYYYQMLEVAGNNGIEHGDLLYTISRMPNVIVPQESAASEAQWVEILQVVQEALAQFVGFRQTEGQALFVDIKTRIELIMSYLQQVTPFEQERTERIRTRLLTALQQAQLDGKYDTNRFEQELLFYIERLDFSEERTRLQQHCTYFLQEMDSNAPSKGNKLGFICQEMGREINTLSSKANFAEIQHLVVQMKDELEKIKEQLANVL